MLLGDAGYGLVFRKMPASLGFSLLEQAQAGGLGGVEIGLPPGDAEGADQSGGSSLPAGG
jgi:hypothetical protein